MPQPHGFSLFHNISRNRSWWPIFPLILCLCLTVFSLLCSSCSLHLNNNGHRPTTITLSFWGSAQELELFKQLSKEFEVAHPTIHVRLMHIPDHYFQKLHILMASDLAPDVMFINSLSLPVYASSGQLAPLDHQLKDTDNSSVKPIHEENSLTATENSYGNLSLNHSLSAQVGLHQFFPQALSALSYNEQLYAVPRDISNLVVYVNTDMFEQYGLELPSPDWTLGDMHDMASVFSEDTNGDGKRDQFGISFYGTPPLLWMPFILSEGIPLFDGGFKQFTLATPLGIRALQDYANLRHRWHAAPTRQEVGQTTMSQLFLQKKLAMMVSGRWSTPVLREQAKFHWDVLPFPQGTHGSVVGIDASGFAMSSHSKHPKASWQLIQFLSSSHAQEVFTHSGLIIPARQDVAYSNVFLSPDKAPKNAQVFIDTIATGYPTHTPPQWDEIAETLNEALEPVWDGAQPVSLVLPKIKPTIERLMQP